MRIECSKKNGGDVWRSSGDMERIGAERMVKMTHRVNVEGSRG